MLKKFCHILLLLSVVMCLLAMEPGDLGEPWSEIGQLIKDRDYSYAIDKLREAARASSDVEYLSEIYYRIGFIHHELTHNYDEALKAYQEVMNLGRKAKSSSSELEIYVILSRMGVAGIYRRVGRYDDAIETYQKMAADYPGTQYQVIAKGKIKDIENSLKEIELKKQIISKYPDTDFAAEAQFDIAELYLPIQPQRAIQEYTKLVRQYPDSRRSAEAQLKIGNIYRMPLNKPEEAISAYQKLVQDYPVGKLGAEALLRIGRLYIELSQHNKALDTFSRLLKNYPTYWKIPAVFYWQGICYEQLEDYDNAVRAFGMFVQVYPDEEPDWLTDIGRFREKKVKVDVESRIEKLKEAAPERLWRDAERLRSQKKYSETLVVYRDLMGKYPDSAYSGKAKIQADGVRNLAEIQIYQDVVRKGNSEAPAAQYSIARMYETEMQDYIRAVEEYEKIAANYPGTYWAEDALYRTGLIYSGMNSPVKSEKTKRNLKLDYNKAIEKYRQLIREHPDTYTAAESYYRIGEIYRTRLKSYDKALEAYRKVVNDYPKREFYRGEGYKDSLADEAQFRIGSIYYENMNDYSAALDTFTKFLDDYPQSCRKAAAYSFIASIREKKKDKRAALESFERVIDIIVDSDVQSSFFVRDATYDTRSLKNSLRGFELQRDILKYTRQKISQLQE